MGSTKLLSSKQMDIELVKGIKDLWENFHLFDFTLKVEYESIPVHKVILASCSGYFRAMFNSSMKESSERSVELKGLKASAVKSVINFIYTGDIELSTDTLEDILSAADYLQIHLAVCLCCDYVLENMSWDTVCHVQHLAQMFALNDMERQVENFMLTYFSDMPEEVSESVGKHILKLVVNKDLCVSSEYVLFEKLLLFKTILSEDEFYEALSQVRFPLMSKNELEKVSKTGVMTTRLSHLMDEAWEYHKDVMRQPLLQTERTQVRSGKVTMVLAYKNCITGVYEDQPPKDILTNEHRGTLQKLGTSDIKEIVVVDNYLYICHDILVSYDPGYIGFFRYDPRFDLWQKLERLLDRSRIDFPLVACGKQIFAIGGFWSRSMEIYDIQTNQWQFGTDINYDNCHSTGISLGKKIYVCGGGIYNDIHGFSVEDTLSCYDPTEDTWQTKAPMIAERSKHRIAVVDEKIFVFGGVNDAEFHFDAEYYSPDVDQWTVIHDALSNVIDGLCANGSDVYILRRDSVRSRLDEFMEVSFEKFNFETGSTEEDEFIIEMPNLDYDETCPEGFHILPYICSTLVLASK